ncbi:MAG: riboflavin synthase [Phycisphaerae bacterium]|jgi:riboflavin synthase
MFTGIVQHIGSIRTVRDTPAGRALLIDLGRCAEGLAVGDSVAVNGVCLTAAELAGQAAWFDAVAQTLAMTTLGQLRSGAKVNLERAARLGQEVGGHLVQGHIDGIARVRSVRRGSEHVIDFAAEPALTGMMVPQGSIAIDGVSLTLATAAEGRFSVALIPTTLGATTLADLQSGSAVNIETDLIGKYVLKYLRGLGESAQAAAPGLTLQKLKDAGFA